ncbi:MAG: pilus assembly protein N-terminal domain-containing protein [Bdellovibrionales bacterium]
MKTTLYMLTGLMLIAPVAHAQNAGAEPPIDIIPTQSKQTEANQYNDAFDTHPPLKLSPDRSELIRLEKDAGSIIIGNPENVSVLADSARTLVVVPQIPGATHITILDKQDNILMQRHIIIGSPKKKYVRIRKSCNAEIEGCEPTQIYYCPDTCHKVSVAQEESESTSLEAEEAATANLPQGSPPPDDSQ